MNRPGPQPKLVGVVAGSLKDDDVRLNRRIREELSEIREFHHSAIIVVTAVNDITALSFLRICAELRIPMILFLPLPAETLLANSRDDEAKRMARALMEIALAKYQLRDSGTTDAARQKSAQAVIEFADALLVLADHGASHDLSLPHDARDLGIPTKIIGLEASDPEWSIASESERPARHGFETRKELLEFLDARFVPAD